VVNWERSAAEPSAPGQATPDPLQLEPVARIALEPATGGVPIPILHFDNARGLVYVQQPLFASEAQGWTAKHAPDLALLILLVTVTGLAIVLWRTLPRPRRSGVLYCRRCNYELGEAGSAAESCPECGRRGAGLAVRGRSRRRRLAVPVAAGLVLLAACAIVLNRSLVWRPGNPADRPWPTVHALWISTDWPLNRAEGSPRSAHRITAHRISDGALVGHIATLPIHGAHEALLTPAGDSLIAIVGDGMESHLHIHPLRPAGASGSARRYALLDDDERGSSSIIGMSGDGARVYISNFVNWHRAFPQMVTTRTQLVSVELATGERRKLASLTLANNAFRGGRQTPTQRAAVREMTMPDGSAAITWALLVHRGFGTGTNGTTVIADIEGFDPRRASGGDPGDGASPVQPGRFTYAIEFDGGSWYEPKYADDDTLIITSYGGGDVRLDVRDGSLMQDPPPTWQRLGGPHHSGRIAGRFGEDGAMLRYVAWRTRSWRCSCRPGRFWPSCARAQVGLPCCRLAAAGRAR
jgi:hypothetical protein